MTVFTHVLILVTLSIPQVIVKNAIHLVDIAIIQSIEITAISVTPLSFSFKIPMSHSFLVSLQPPRMLNS